MLEKLIEEISGRIQFVADIGLQSFQATSAVEWALEKERRGLALAEELITRIGKAYAEGLEIAGEVTPRFQVSALSDKVNTMEGVERHIKWLADAMGEGADIFIALRKEGMDKKEEECPSLKPLSRG